MKAISKQDSEKVLPIYVAPTDTIYGLLAPALDRDAVEQVYALKERNPKKPFIILIRQISDLSLFGIKNMPPAVSDYLQQVWPGPVSVILPLSKDVCSKFQYLHRGTKTLAFRLPLLKTKSQKESVGKLLKKHGPLVAPSANPEGETPAATVQEARKYFGSRVQYLSVGKKVFGYPSKLVKITPTGRIKILRD